MWPQFNGSSFVAPLVIFQVVVLALGLGLGLGLKSDEENVQSYRFNSTCKYYDNASFKQKNVKNQKIKWLEQSCSSNHEICPDGWDFCSTDIQNCYVNLLTKSILRVTLIHFGVQIMITMNFTFWQLEIWICGYESCSFYWKMSFECMVFFRFDKPPLIIVSLDGFRADYMKRNLTPVLDKIGRCGVRTDRMRSIFPTKTFPNHFSIVTVSFLWGFPRYFRNKI